MPLSSRLHQQHKLPYVNPCTSFLTGSEKWDTRQDIGGQHAQELANINSSLFTLGRCIAALCAKGGPPTHVPYRESKLTR